MQFPPLHTAAVTGLCYSHLEKKMTFSAATTEDVMLGSQLIDDKKQIPQYSTYFKCLCWKLLLKKYYYYLQVNLCKKHLFSHKLSHNMWLKIVHWFTSSVNENYKLRTCCVHKLFFFILFWHSEQFMYTTCSELVVFMYWTGKSINNLLSYCGLIDGKNKGF